MESKDTPRWYPNDLAEHHAKRLNKDNICWQEIMGRAAPMTRGQYASESYLAWRHGVIEYTGIEQRHADRLYRVDGRGIKTAASPDRHAMVTCFHHHDPCCAHVAGTAANLPGEQVAKYLDWMLERVKGGETQLQSIKLIKQNLPKNALRSKAGPLVPKVDQLRKEVLKRNADADS
jgi:hypothetical protein